MIILLVDGDYLLSGFKPSSSDEVRGAIERLEDALTKQLLPARGSANQPPAYTSRIDFRVALFSSALINSLTDAERNTVISGLRRLRFQTSVLESVSGRPGSPIDAALCTKAIMFAMMPGDSGSPNGTGGSSDHGNDHSSGRHVFCFVSPNAYVASALDLLTTRGCDAIFTVYEGDEVAEELLGYVSAAYGPGIATMPKRAGVAFIPNTEAASAALAALQQEGKDLPLSVLQELKNMQNSLTTRNRPRPSRLSSAGSASAAAGGGGAATGLGSGDSQAVVIDESRRRVKEEQAMFAPPPPLAGVPNPFENEASAPPAESDEDASATPYVYHGDDDDNNYGSARPKSSAPASQRKQNFATPNAPPTAVVAAEPVVVTTSTSPSSVVRAARAPAGAPPPPVSNATLVASPPAGVSGEPAVATTVPAGWALLFDSAWRRFYFAHRGTDGAVVSSWEHPLGQAEARVLEQDVEAWYRHAMSKQAPSPPSQQDPGAALPPGWEERIDPRSGRKFYVNHVTKATTWDAPTTATATAASNANSSTGALPANWEERVDPRNGRPYYVNHATRETTWTRPSRTTAAAVAVAAGTVDPQQRPVSGSGCGADEWEERKDPTGRTFYVNHRTKQTTWTKPAATQAWEAKVDPRTGRTFYVNHETKQTAWQIPNS